MLTRRLRSLFGLALALSFVGSDCDDDVDHTPQGNPSSGFSYVSSNVAGLDFTDLPRDFIIDAECNLNTDRVGGACGHMNSDDYHPSVVRLPGGGEAMLLVVKSFTLKPNIKLFVTGPLPLIVVAKEDITIGGPIYVSPSLDARTGVAGGFSPATPPERGGGTGGGRAGANANSGGAHCGRGGGSPLTPPSDVYGVNTLIPLQGGSAGGGGFGGAGGGAIQLSAGSKLLIAEGAFIQAGGGGGGNSPIGGGGGGGAGGGILLEAASIAVIGGLYANGGGGGSGSGSVQEDGAAGGQTVLPSPGGAKGRGGAISGGDGSGGDEINGTNGASDTNPIEAETKFHGSGGGGAGWIRLNGNTKDIKGTISPTVASGCATLGELTRR